MGLNAALDLMWGFPPGASAPAPANTEAPAITGTALVGEELTVSDGTWTGEPAEYAYQWNRDGVAIDGATAAAYTLVLADFAAAITATVTATNAGGSTAATSAATDAVSFADTFTRADGDLDNGWEYTPGIWTISGGKVTSNPTEGADVAVNGNMETGNPPTGYGASAGSILAGVADERTGGSGVQSLSITRGTNDAAGTKNVSITAKQWHRVSQWWRNVTSTRLAGQFGFSWRAYSDTAWGFIEGVGLDPDTIWGHQFYVAGAGGEGRFDDFALRPLTRNHLFCTRDLKRPDVRFTIDVSNLDTNLAGVVFRADHPTDPQNYILALVCPYLSFTFGAVLTVIKVIDGVPATVANQVGLTYSDPMTVTVEMAGYVLRIFQDGDQRGTDYFITDAVLQDSTRHGMFNSGDGTMIDRCAAIKAYPIALDGSLAKRFSVVTPGSVLWSTSGTDDWLGRALLADLGTHWIAIYYSGISHFEAINRHVRFSDDEGVTWTDEDTYLDASAVSVPGWVPTVAPNGDLLVFNPTASGAACYRSTDGGKTYGAPVYLSDDPTHYPDESFVFGDRIYVCVQNTGEGGAWPYDDLRLFVSDDDGASWTLHAIMPTNELGNEFTIASLDGTNFIAIKREALGVGTWISRSSDAAVTWTDWAQMPDFGVVQKPTLRVHAGGYILWGRDGRLNVTAVQPALWYSMDGVNWGRHFHVDTQAFNDGAYGDFLPRADGTFYWMSYGGSTAVASMRHGVFGITE